MEYARNLPDKTVVSRFMHLQEVFGTKSAPPAYIDLSPQESFVFSRFENSSLSVVDVKNLSGLSDSETLKILYTLWLGGFLNRQKWNTAFSDRKTSKILSASISLIKGQEAYVSNESQPSGYKMPEMTKPETPIEETKQVIENISLAGYLAQVENAANFYEILDVEPKAIQTDIKQAYFSLAKRFHPDLFHKEVDADLQQRVQHAFGKLAQAYDTLRHEKSREVYNYKIRKDLETKEKRQKTNFGSENAGNQKQFEQALDDFEQGLSLLMDEEFETAIPFLARAVHLANNNARFHAYYGKALASDKNQRHKAEAELQAAVKLDENNANYRLMLAEFFIEVGLAKRAEGELNRLLAIFPDNKEATILLDTLRTK
jgi:curved DNA-binding protein CbpA